MRLQLFGYVRARMADNVNLLLLRFVAPEKMPDPEEFAPHKNTITLPPSVMQGLKAALHKQRKFLSVSPACDQDFQDDEDSIPPANVVSTHHAPHNAPRHTPHHTPRLAPQPPYLLL